MANTVFMNIITLILSLSLTSKYEVLASFYNESNKFYSLKSQIESTKEEKETLYDNASEMYTQYLGTYFDKYLAPSNNKKKVE